MATVITTAGTWSLDPEFPVEVRPERVGIVSPSTSGSVQRRDVQCSVGVDSGEPTTRRFTLRWKYATETEWDALVALWEATARGVLPVAYTPPDGTEVAVRISGPPSRTRKGPTHSEFMVTLEEVLNA